MDQHRGQQDRGWRGTRESASVSTGMIGAGHAGVVAGFGRHQTVDRALAEHGPVSLLTRLAAAYEVQAADILADAGHDADERADAA